jgi:glycosyltransferase involved in cell wall biosynthesis
LSWKLRAVFAMRSDEDRRAASFNAPPVRIGVFENLANSAYIVTKVLRQNGHAAELILDPFDRYVMSDPRWEDLDLELPTDQLAEHDLPEVELPDWVRRQPGTARAAPSDGRSRPERAVRALAGAPRMAPQVRLALRVAGWRGALMLLERAWVVRTLAQYDCVIAYGAGPAWAAFAGVPYVAETWGGDITMVPFYDTGDWESHETVPLPGPPADMFAEARLQRLGYERAGRILLTDPRFFPYAERLGHADKCEHMGFFIDTEKYAPGPEPELRRELLGDRDGPIVFMPSRQDWFWKGSDRLLRGFAQASRDHPGAVLVCPGWGADLDRSRQLIAELGIGERTRLLPSAMSKGRLRRYYRASDIVADQFTVGSYGGSALEAMSCARPLLIGLDRDRFEGRFDTFPPVVNVSEPEEIGRALTELFGDADARRRVGEQARDWVVANHGPPLVERTVALCRAVMEGR